MTDDDEFIGSAEACEILGIDRATLVRRIAAGKIRSAFKSPGLRGPYMFTRAEIERHAAEPQAVAS
jgi:predicted site-specific integrase-resolvase